MNILFSWLGTQDIKSMANDESAAICSIATHSDVTFDEIVILANDKDAQWPYFQKFLEKRLYMSGRPSNGISIRRAFIKTPIDYYSIHKETEKWFNKLSNKAETLTINLTSGTPAMTAVSILVGKGKSNTRFVQSSKDHKFIEVDIPVDFGAAYMASATKHLAQKASAPPLINSSQNDAFSSITAKSEAMQTVIKQAKKIAQSEVPALILGETGTGKELMANAIHKASLRNKHSIKIINCGALPETIVDSTLFGHKKGAFTGADKDYAGVFEQADGGTLFLDEIGELKPDIQVKLLRALQQGEITRLGDTQTINVDVRIVAATHQNLIALVESGQFREDLFYRLAVGIIKMPPLRERKEDIPLLVDELAEQINTIAAKHPSYISKKINNKVNNFIISQAWRGNIRELWSTINRVFLWSDSSEISVSDFQNALINRSENSQNDEINLGYNDVVNLNQIIENTQKNYIKAALKASGNVKTHATKMLSLKDHQKLTYWMEKLGIDKPK